MFYFVQDFNKRIISNGSSRAVRIKKFCVEIRGVKCLIVIGRRKKLFYSAIYLFSSANFVIISHHPNAKFR